MPQLSRTMRTSRARCRHRAFSPLGAPAAPPVVAVPPTAPALLAPAVPPAAATPAAAQSTARSSSLVGDAGLRCAAWGNAGFIMRRSAGGLDRLDQLAHRRLRVAVQHARLIED